MTNEVFRKAIGEALHPEFAAMIPDHGEHIFSEKFERKMEKLIRRRRKPYYSLISTSRRRAACIIVMFLVVSFTTVMSVEALRKPFLDFLSSIFSDHTTIESVLDLDGDYPETIEERYMISAGLEEYELESNEYRNYIYNYYYKSKTDNRIIIFSQIAVKRYVSNINTENSSITNVRIGNIDAVGFYDNQGYYTLIWNTGKSIIQMSSNIGENALKEMAKFVKKIE